MHEAFSMSGQRVLVTGASSGFGAGFARILAAAGADLVLAARRQDRLAHTAEQVRALGRQAHVVPMDVNDAASVAAAFQAMPVPDVVINNAGITRVGTAATLEEQDWDAVVQTNLRGVWAVTRAAVRTWQQQGRGGNLINIASILGLRVQSQLAVYAATKAAVVQLTRSVALDHARDGIRCNALCPGYVATDLNRDWLASPSGEAMIRRIPARRAGTLDDLAGPLLLLASPASAYMTGVALPVDGGHLVSSL